MKREGDRFGMGGLDSPFLRLKREEDRYGMGGLDTEPIFQAKERRG